MNIAESEFVPISPVGEIGSSGHVVQFYESDDYLIESVRSFIAVGLVTGDTCVVVATPEHHAELMDRLRASGLEMAVLAERGQYVALEAHELLERFMLDGVPDPELFVQTVGTIVEGAVARSRRVRIFGEMVALLCAEGNHQSAIQLEALWNGLQTRYDFSLFCGYPVSSFGTEALAESHRHVCGEHSEVIPAESYHAVTDARERLRIIAELQQKAESLKAEVEERKAAEQALARSLRLRDEFLASVSHDLKTPLTVLQGQAQLLRRRALRDTLDQASVLEASEQIEGRSRSMAALIDELLDVTRLRAGEDLPLHRGAVELSRVVRDVLAACEDLSHGHTFVLTDAESLTGWWDEQRLRRVFQNLIGNAIKYSPRGGRITIGLEQDGIDAVVTVNDEGIGVPASDLPHIFEPFYRGANTDRRTAGTGIGLAGAREIVERHGGTISLESCEGIGTTVTVRLPMARPSGTAT